MIQFNSPRRALVVAVFAVIGVVALIASFAETPPPGSTVEQKIAQTRLSDFSPLDSPVIGLNKKMSVDGKFNFQTQIPKTWQVFKYNGDDSAYLILHARSPEAKLEDASSEGGFVVESGAIIEVSIFKNTKYKDTTDYFSHIGVLAKNSSNLVVAGNPAVRYEIEEEEAEEAAHKENVSFVAKGNLYVISYIYANETVRGQFAQVFNNSLTSTLIGD